MRGVALVLFILLPVQSVGNPAQDTLLTHLEREVTLAAGKMEEPCMAMAMADRLEYGFDSSAALNFNIHYHQENAVFFPVQHKNVDHGQSEYIANGSRQYCLMWTNHGAEPVTLRYRYRVFRQDVHAGDRP